MSHENEFTDINFPTVNVVHDTALEQHFEDGIGRRVLIITPSFPYIMIGEIIELIEDFVVVDVETASISELEDRIWHIHVHNIEVFFIERDDGPRIPRLDNGMF